MKIFQLLVSFLLLNNVWNTYEDDGNLSHYAEFASQPKTIKYQVRDIEDKVDILYQDLQLGINQIQDQIEQALGGSGERRLKEQNFDIDLDFQKQEQNFEKARQKLIELSKFNDSHKLKKLIEPQFNYD